MVSSSQLSDNETIKGFTIPIIIRTKLSTNEENDSILHVLLIMSLYFTIK